MRQRLTAAVLVTALTGIAARPSMAYAAPMRVLVESSCPSSVLDLFELLYLLRVELPPGRVEVGATLDELGSPARADMQLSLCADGRLDGVSLRVADAPAEAHELDVSGLPENARARALALALTEIIASALPAATRAPVVPVPAAALPHEATPKASAAKVERPSADTYLGAALAARAVALPRTLDAPTLLYGPALAFDISRWHFGAVMLFGQDESAYGTIALASATSAAAYDLWRRSGELVFAVRARGELGVTWATAEPVEGASGRSAAALAASALLELGMLAPLSGPWLLDVRIAPGYARGLGALAAGHRTATTHGLVLGVSAGLAWQLPP